AVMREDGYVNIVGRIKDLVIRGGENVYPREIEEFLYGHPDIQDVAVIGVPDERYGEELMAWIRMRPGAAPHDAAAVRAFCVGCGTGIASRPFQDRGCRVTGVEPDERMAAVARRHGLAVEVSRFEDWDPAGRRFDLVVSAQAWHWVDPARGAAQAERALRSGG